MTVFENIYEIAADNYGLITTAEANSAGAANKDILRFLKDGRLARIGRGVYRVKHYIPTTNDAYAECVALVGPEAYLFGESVIAMHELAPTNPRVLYVATPKRIRKDIPEGIRVIKRPIQGDTTAYEGIPSQTIPAAIRSCKGTMMTKRLIEATKHAREKGLIRADEEAELLEELTRG